MYNITRAVKVTEDGRIRNLAGLVTGDNLEREGRREIVESLEEHKGLYSLTTMRITRPSSRLVRNRYLASAQMLNEGELRAEIPENFEATYFDQQFYERHFVTQKPVEAVA